MSDLRGHRDKTVAICGGEKTQRVNLGLELLTMLAIPGEGLTQDDIAAWCGCSRDAIYLIEKKALRQLRNKLMFGMESATGRELR